MSILDFEFIRLLRDNRYIVYYCTTLHSAENEQQRKAIEQGM